MDSQTASGSTGPEFYCHQCFCIVQPVPEPTPHCPLCESRRLEEVTPSGHFVGSGNSPPRRVPNNVLEATSLDLGNLVHNLIAPFTDAVPRRHPMANPRRPPSAEGSELPPLFGYEGDETPTGPMGAGLGSYGPFPRHPRHPPQAHNPRPDDGMGGAGGTADGRPFFQLGPSGSDSRAGRGGSRILRHMIDQITNLYQNGAGQDIALEALAGFGPVAAQLVNTFYGTFPILDARAGDYIFDQNSLDDIIAQALGQSRGPGEVPPASEELIARLPRLKAGTPTASERAKNEECPVCLESIGLDENASPSPPCVQEDEDDPPEVAPGEQAPSGILIGLPCNHVAHEECIIPWLKRSGTCPVCREVLDPHVSRSRTNQSNTPQPAQRRSDETPHHPRERSQDVGTFEDTDEEEEEGGEEDDPPIRLPGQYHSGPRSPIIRGDPVQRGARREDGNTSNRIPTLEPYDDLD